VRGPGPGDLGARVALAAIAVFLAAAAAPSQARAQATSAPPDSVALIAEPPRPTPPTYDTSYDRDVSTGTWTQTLTYAVVRNRLTVGATGSSTTLEFPRSPGLGGRNGSFGGVLSYHASQRWLWSLSGTYNRVASTDVVSETSQRQNRLKISTQYNLNPWRTMSLMAAVSSELQQDHGLTVRPLGQERVRLLTRYDAAGDSVGVDSIFVHDQRDSTYMSGRQDGASALMKWSPKNWLQVEGDASGTRVDPVTTTALRDFARAVNGSPVEVADRSRFESPNSSEAYLSKLTYT